MTPTKARNDVCPQCGQKRKRCQCARRMRRFLIAGLLVVGAAAVFVGLVLRPASFDLPTQPRTGQPDPGENPMVIARCDSVLRDLVQTHPDPVIRDTLNHLIVNGTIYKNYQLSHGLAGLNLGSMQIVRLPDGQEVPVMQFDPNALLDPMIDRRAKQLIIRHEFYHYGQLVRGEVPRHTFYPRRGDASMDWPEARQLLMAEWPAYLVEAKLAADLGWLDAIPLIGNYRAGPRALARALGTDLLQSPTLRPHQARIYALLDSLARAEEVQ